MNSESPEHRVTLALVDAGLVFEFGRAEYDAPVWTLRFANDVDVEIAVMQGWVVATASSETKPRGWKETELCSSTYRTATRTR